MSDLRVPLFSRTELTAAFALLAPPEEAGRLAARWFAEFADATDEFDRYVLAGGWGDEAPLAPGEDPTDQCPPELQGEADRRAAGAVLFRNMGPADLESILLGLGDLHLALLAVVSEENFERMRLVRRMSRRGAERNRLQIRRTVEEWRARWLTTDGHAWKVRDTSDGARPDPEPAA